MKKQRLAVLLIALVVISLFAVSCKEKKTYVSIDTGDGGTNTKIELVDGKITLPELSKEGYDFKGWKVDGVEKKAGDKVAYSDKSTYEPVFVKQVFTVSFESGIDGVELNFDEQRVEYGEKASDPGNLPSSIDFGKELDYWKTEDGSKFDFDKDVIKSNTTLTVVWKYKEYQIGATGPAGGIIFYDAGEEKTLEYNEGGTKKTISWRYLEVAPENATDSTTSTSTWIWGTSGTYSLSNSLGGGLINTYALVALSKADGSAYDFPAAKMAANYKTSKTQFADWYLPNEAEVRELGEYLNGKDVGYKNFNAGQYWTSSVSSSTQATTLYLTIASGNVLSKGYSSDTMTNKLTVRAIRQF